MSHALREHLGPYELVARLGGGGMGEVFRARDRRIGRDVAVKVLAPGASADPERLQRFEVEARAAGALNHPNIVAVFDAGREGAEPFIVTELLEGQTLRERLSAGPLPPRKAAELGMQMARGLAAAHERGITHRDLKPENVFVTRDAQVKILDFGLAHMRPAEGDGAGSGTLTASGAVLGTAGYMAPEQLRGEPAEAPADLFALGAILYELLSGERAFPGASALERGMATLQGEPPELGPAVPPALAALVARCLEKRPEDRFQSARDLAFALEVLGSGTSGKRAPQPATTPARRWPRRALGAAALVATAAAAALAGSVWSARTAEVLPHPTFTRVTFRLGALGDARFSPDGHSVVFSAMFGGEAPRVFVAIPGHPELRPISGPRMSLSSVSHGSDVAVITTGVHGAIGRMTLTDSTVREVTDHADFTDWDDHGELMLVQNDDTAGRSWIEYPRGKVLYRRDSGLDDCRFSRAYDRIACLYRAPGQFSLDAPGALVLVGLDGSWREVGGWWKRIRGLAWAPGDAEVWVSASRDGDERALHAVRLDGRTRPLLLSPVDLRLHDVSPEGRALITRGSRRQLVVYRDAQGEERDVSWFEASRAQAFSRDGAKLLLADDHRQDAYLMDLTQRAVVKLGQGVRPRAISSDGSLVLACGDPPRCDKRLLLPVRSGVPRQLARGGVQRFFYPQFTDGDRKVAFMGERDGTTEPQVWLQPLDGEPRAITPPGMGHSLTGVSPDGRWLAALDAQGDVVLVPAAGDGPVVEVPGTRHGEPVGWLQDGRLVVWQNQGQTYVERFIDDVVLHLMDVRTGKRQPWKVIHPAGRDGFAGFNTVRVHPSGAFVYTAYLDPGDLVIVDGLAPR